MALQGNLKDFEIPEVFQLIATQQKTGILKIESGDSSFGVYFSRGFIQFVERNPSAPGLHFVNFLARSGIIKKRLAQEINRIASKTSESAIRILLKEEDLDVEALKRGVNLYIMEQMLNIITLKRGEFQFVTRKVDLDQQIFEPLTADHVLMETYRIADELKKEVGDAQPWNDVYELVMERRDAFEEAKGLGLKGDELKLVLLIDGRRTLEDLAFRSTLGRLEAWRTISRLISAGIVHKREIEKVEKKEEPLKLKPKERAWTFYLFTTIVAAVFAFVVFARITAAESGTKTSTATFADFYHRVGTAKIRSALYVYKKLTGTYPSELKVLFQNGSISPHELTFPLKDVYYIYITNEDNYVLLIPLQQ